MVTMSTIVYWACM